MVTPRYSRASWATFLIILVFFSGLCAQAQYGGGTGEPNNPYLIYTAEQMNAIGGEPNDWDKHFKLMADIDLSGYTGTDFNIIGFWVDWNSRDNRPFAGVFDGNGHTISNFTCTSRRKGCVGLFGYVNGRKAHIKDLGLVHVTVHARSIVGSLAGQIFRGAVTNCYVKGGAIRGNGCVGGLVGQNWGTITNCYANVSVTGRNNTGGLVGHNRIESSICRCFSTGRISGRECVGGLTGNNRGAITDCYASGKVLGAKIVGGLAGSNGWPYFGNFRPYPAARITNCYSTVRVSRVNASGGLVGKQGRGGATASFWDVETSGQTRSAGGTGKTTAEMQMTSTFVGWGCERTVWTIDEGVDYPRLAWENKGGHPMPALSDSLTGSGTQTEPYLIYTAQELNMISQFPCEWDKHFKLMADIDLSGFNAKAFNTIGDWRPFTGVFDGNGHTISNFRCTSTEGGYTGLFRYVGKDGEDSQIKNLGLIEPKVDAEAYHYVGSLIGRLHYGTITGCYARGGIVSGDKCVVGGLVGWLDKGNITNCYCSVSVKGTNYLGGLVGYSYRGTITKCYSVGDVSGGESVGGLVGKNFLGMSKDSLWDIQTSGQSASDGGTGKTTAEMQKQSTFTDAGWDFVDEMANGTEDIWRIFEGRDYPRLRWELIFDN